MNTTRKLHQELAAVGQPGKQLSGLGKTSLSRFLYGDGPGLVDRLAGSVEHSKTTHYEIINKACEALLVSEYAVTETLPICDRALEVEAAPYLTDRQP